MPTEKKRRNCDSRAHERPYNGTEKAFAQRRTPIDDVALENKLAEIFAETVNFNYQKIIFLRDKIKNCVEGKIKEPEFIKDYLTGNIENSFGLRKYITDNFNPSNDQINAFNDFLHAYIINNFDIIKAYFYILNTFPLFSHLKRFLLKIRQGTDIKQYEYIYNDCGISEAEYNIFKNATHYKDIDNELAASAISKLVNHEIPNAKFENTISQKKNEKGWFRNGFNQPPTQHQVKIQTLLMLGYAFNLSVKDFEELCEGSVNVFQYKNTVECFRKVISSERNMTVSDFNNQIQVICELYNTINETRFINATSYVTDLFNSIDPQKIKEYIDDKCVETRYEIATIYEKSCIDSKFSIPLGFPYNYSSLNSLLEKIENNMENLREILKHNYDIDKQDDCKKLAAIIVHLCDGFAEIPHTGITIDALTKKRIITIYNSENTRSIRRGEILRIGYVTTLIRYINNYPAETNYDIISDFEEITNKMLDECKFHPLHNTLPLDALMYISLSSTDMFIPIVYQLLLQRFT